MLTNNIFISLAHSEIDSTGMEVIGHDHYFEQFHKDSIFRVRLARNIWEKLSLATVIAGTLATVAWETHETVKATPVVPWAQYLTIAGVALLVAIIRPLTLECSWKYFKNNFLHTFMFMLVLLSVITMITVPAGFFLNPYNNANGPLNLLKYVFHDQATDMNKELIANIFGMQLTVIRLLGILIGITLTVLATLYINDMIKNNTMTMAVLAILVSFLVMMILSGLSNNLTEIKAVTYFKA